MVDGEREELRPTRGGAQGVELHELLDQQDVSVVYQPLIDTIDKRVLGYEALTRTSHERFQSPETLFRTAADEGSLWALERICRNCALQNLPALESDQKLFLNVEPETFHDPELQSESFLEAIQQAGLQPSRVVFELDAVNAASSLELRWLVMVELSAARW